MEKLIVSEVLKSQTRRFNEIFDEISQDYTYFVDELSKDHEDDVFWWTTTFASRNPNLSETQKKIAIVLLVLETIEREGSSCVETSDKAIANTLNTWFKKSGTNCIAYLSNNKRELIIGRILRANARITGYILSGLRVKFQMTRLSNKRNDSPTTVGDEYVLIQSYILSSEFESGMHVSRDFYNIESYTNKKIIWYPWLSINNGWNTKKVIKACYKDKARFVLRETYLRIQDYLELYKLSGKCSAFCMEKALFRDVNVAEIVNEDIIISSFSYNTYYGILDYLALRRMSMEKLKFSSIVGWYEGQPSSIGFFMGARRFFSETQTIGYIGLPVDRNWIQLSPSCGQVKNEVVPQRITVIGDAFVETIKRFCGDLCVSIAPAFRMNISSEGNGVTVDRHKVMISLPLSREASKHLMHLINEAELSDYYELYLRNHPDNKGTSVKEYGVLQMKHKYAFRDEGTFAEAVRDCGIVVMYAGSTAGFEAILMGKKVVYYLEEGKIRITGNPAEWRGVYCYEIFEPSDLGNALDALSRDSLASDIKIEQYISYNSSVLKEFV